ncbi:MAG: hypothetical protein AVDCRST_MAG66-2431 [uncultured Pseudonocardia sp.]|uniref:Uncharacterized protein n=1 Tax=uncultured Pseudonocardia sp. TaxID=211455 RepID=A0A6J4PPL6_9PSEU|nr:MAG: hypothetical protein AVDCRST_MAG66-2431 [uncultured Pseudonocardia sp.]
MKICHVDEADLGRHAVRQPAETCRLNLIEMVRVMRIHIGRIVGSSFDLM